MDKTWRRVALVLASAWLAVGCDNSDEDTRTQELGTKNEDAGDSEVDACRVSNQDPASTGDLGASIDEWKARCAREQYSGAVQGTCADGTVLLYYFTGTSNEWRHFDSDGHFVAVEFSGDVDFPGGCTRKYNPALIECVSPTIATIFCRGWTTTLSVGGRLLH